MPRSISTIARDIRRDWSKPYFGAVPYLDAMQNLDTMQDRFYYDSAESVVRYFLSNASSWKGGKAREIKAELKAMLKGGK
jgi:hypothetical protein